MARKKETLKNTGKRKLKPNDLKALWQKVSVQQWYMLLQKINRDGQWTVSGQTIKGRCPYHDDHTPSFVLNFKKCIGKCFGSCGKTVTDPVQLFARLQNQSYAAAVTFLATQFDIADIIGPGADELTEFNTMQEMKKATAVAMRKIIEEYIRDKPTYLDYLRPALIYLVEGRKLPLNLLCSLPVGIFAKPEHLKKYIPEEYHSVFDTYFAKVDGHLFWGAPCFHYNDQPGSISHFKLRKMSRDAEELCNAYKDNEPVPYDIARNLAEKVFLMVEDPFISELGVFGLHYYSRMLGATDVNAYVTEGEFDALSVMVAQLSEGRTDFMIFAFGGNGNSGLSFLRELGVRTVWIIQDTPLKHGNDVVRRLLLNKANFISNSVNKALSYKIFQWPPDIQGSDLDEAVQLMGYTTLVPYFLDNRSANFLNQYSWVVRQCDLELEHLRADTEARLQLLNDSAEDQTKGENLEAELKQNIVTVVKNWFRCIHDQVDRLSFVQKYTQSEGIDFSRLQDVHTAMYALDTFDGAVALLEDSMKDYMELVYFESTNSGSQFTAWSKHLHEKSIVAITDNGLETLFAQFVGQNMTKWVQSLLPSSPLLLSQSTKNEMQDRRLIRSNSLTLLKQAIMNMVAKTKPLAQMISVGQGIHYKDINFASSGGAVYFVNGANVFRGKYGADSGMPVEWEFLNSTVENDLYFMLSARKKWSVISDVSDLYAGAQLDVKKLYNQLQILLDGWRFEHHELTRDYLAAWILSLPIQRAIGAVNITFLTGETTSGKTSFTRGLLGGTMNGAHFEVPSVIEGSWFASDASPAAIYQELDQSSLTLCLDEAESRQNSSHGERVSAVQEMVYSLPFGGAKMVRGGSTPELRREYTLQMPVIMAAINMASDPVFLSRVVPIYTQKDPARKNIGTYIDEHFKLEEVAQIRKNVSVAFLDKLPDLCRRLPELRTELTRQQTVVKVTDRYISLLLPALVIYDYLGFDAKAMFRNLVYYNRNLLETLNSQDFQSELINAVLYTEGVKTTVDGNIQDYVSPKTLILNGDLTVLNNARCGVNILPERGWIIIFWRDVKYTLLQRSVFRSLDEAALRESVAKNKYLIHGLNEADHRYIVSTLGRTDIKNSAQYSVISSEYLLSSQAALKMKEADNVRRYAEEMPSGGDYEETLMRYEAEVSKTQSVNDIDFSL